MSDILMKLHLPSMIMHYNGGHGQINGQRFRCPMCNGKSANRPNAAPDNTLGIFSTKHGYNMFKCHRGTCNFTGSAWTLVEQFEGLIGEEPKVVVEKMKELGFLSDDNVTRNVQYSANLSDQRERIATVRADYSRALENKGHDKIKAMLLRRSISVRVYEKIKDRIGYDPEDDSVVFPVEAPSGGICAIHKIKAEADAEYPHGNNKKNVGPIGKGFFFYIPENRFPNTVLVEGIIDALTVATEMPNYAVISSIGLGYKKVLDILQSDLKRNLIVCYDNDEHKAGLNAAKKIAIGMKKVQMVDYSNFTIYDDAGNEVKKYKDLNDILMDGQPDLIEYILKNPTMEYGIKFQLEDSGAVYRNDRDMIVISPFNLAKFISDEKQILTHDGDNVYIYNGKCYDMITEKHLDSMVSKTLLLPQYQQLYKGTVRNEFKNFLSDKTYMQNMEEREVENRRYLTLDNCLYDLEDHCTLEHSPHIFTTALLPYNFDNSLNNRNMPNFGRWLMTTFQSQRDMYAYIQEIMGYVLYKGMPRPSIFLPIGGPGTGKSLFLDIITELVGLVNACSVRPNKFGDPTYVAKMHNRLVNICGEINARSFEKNLDVIKDISAGGRVSARFLYQNAFEFAPICKHFFACNDFPNFIDQTHALYDRLYVIPFSKRFRDTNEEIIDYIKIIREELPAIFNWCIVGLRRLIENDFRFSVPESANASKEAFKVMHDPVHNFATTCIVQLPHHVINRRELREVFNEFVRLEYDKTQELTAMEFKAAMEARGIYTTKRGGYDVFKDVFYTDDGRLYKDGLVR